MDIRGKDKVICIMFTLFLAIGFLLCAFYPKKEYSDSERRSGYLSFPGAVSDAESPDGGGDFQAGGQQRHLCFRGFYFKTGISHE